MEAIPHGIVPHDALTTGAADHAVVAQDFTVLATARAGAWLVIHREAQPKLAGNNKLGAAEMETEGRKWRAVEPSTSFWKAITSMLWLCWSLVSHPSLLWPPAALVGLDI